MGRKRLLCVAGHLLRVHLIERALCLTDCASDARFRLNQCAPETALYCASERLSLRAATLREKDEADGMTRPERRASTLQMFIARRNLWPDPGDLTHYRPLSESDAGQAQFVATLRLRGVDVALWRAGGETLVQDITGHEDALAYELTPGATVELSTISLTVDQGEEIEEELRAQITPEDDLVPDRDIDIDF